MVNGYCVKCKAPREIQDPKVITMKNGRPATEGRCPVCGTRIFKIGAPQAAAAGAAGSEAPSPERGEGPPTPGETGSRP